MPHEMAAKSRCGRFPTSERRGAGSETCSYTEVVQETIITQPQHIAAVPISRFLKRTRIENDLMQRERLDARFDFMADKCQRFREWRRLMDGRMPIIFRSRLWLPFDYRGDVRRWRRPGNGCSSGE